MRNANGSHPAAGIAKLLRSPAFLCAVAACAVASAKAGTAAPNGRHPLPAGVTACAFDALPNDPDPNGLNIRSSPGTSGAVLGRLAPFSSKDLQEAILPQFHVIGAKSGWFLIEGAAYNPALIATLELGRHAVKPPKLYAGRGWVSGKLISTGLLTPALKARPSADAADTVSLQGSYDLHNPDGTTCKGCGGYGSQDIRTGAILDCTGEWFEVEVPLDQKDFRLTPAAGAQVLNGSVRGWTHGYCTEQLTTCV